MPPPREARPPAPQGPSLLLIRPVTVQAEELQPKLETLARATGLDPYMTRQRFLGRSLLVLDDGEDVTALEDRAGAIREAGAGAVVIPQAGLEALPEPRRAAGIELRGDRPVLRDVKGTELLEVGPASRILLVLTDLGSQDSLGQRVSQKPAAESAQREGCWEGPVLLAGRGRPVLELFAWESDGRAGPTRARLYGERFNFTGLGEGSLSKSRNLAALVRLLAETAAEIELDLDFGEGSPMGEREEAFTRHASLAYLAHRLGLPPAPPIQTPEARREAAEAAHQVLQAAPVVGRRGRFRRGRLLDDLLKLAPPWISIPLMVGIVPLFALLQITENPIWLGPILVDLGALAAAIGLTALARRRYIQNVPTAKVRSMPMGMVEVRGRAKQTVPLQTPFSGLDCVYYWYQVFAWVRTSKGVQRRCVGSGSSGEVPFYLEDDTGRVLVDPNGANMDIHHREIRQQGKMMAGQMGARQSVETFIPTHFPLYVTGSAHRRIHQPKGPDGTEGAPVEHVVIGRGTGRFFLVSDRTEERLIRVLTQRMVLGLLLGGVLILTGIAVVLQA